MRECLVEYSRLSIPEMCEGDDILPCSRIVSVSSAAMQCSVKRPHFSAQFTPALIE